MSLLTTRNLNRRTASLPLATPAVSIVALLRCCLHRSVSTASSTRLNSATGGSRVMEPVSVDSFASPIAST